MEEKTAEVFIMGKFEGVLLASDLDGTLYNSRGEITEPVRRALRYFIENGGRFTVSTGRSKQGFHAYSSEYINAPVLLANGAMAYDYTEDRTLFADGVNEEELQALSGVIERFPGMSVEFYTADFRAYCISPDDRSRRHFAGQDIVFTEISDLSKLTFPVVKIMIGAGAQTLAVQKFLSGTDLGKIRYIPCTGDFIELLSVTAGKGRGLHRLADMLNIPRERAFAAGDGSNDVDMLRCAAEGFVPENGDPLALAAAGTVVRSCDDGAVAHVIEMLDSRF